MPPADKYIEEIEKLRQERVRKEAEVSRLDQAIRAKEDARLLQLHTLVDLPNVEALIARLKKLVNAPKASATSPQIKEAIRAKLLEKVPVETIALELNVTKRVVNGVKSKLPNNPTS